MLVGIGALWARKLGHYRILPLIDFLLYFVLAGGDVENGVSGVGVTLLDAYPILLDAGWVLLGCLLLRLGNAQLLAERNKALTRRFYEEAWGKGDLEAIDELASPDVVDHHHGGRGTESLKRAVTDLRATFPDLRFTIEDQRAEGDEVVTRWTISGTDRGGVLWYPPTGRTASFSGVFTDSLSGGRLAEHRGESDTAGLREQLGLPSGG